MDMGGMDVVTLVECLNPYEAQYALETLYLHLAAARVAGDERNVSHLIHTARTFYVCYGNSLTHQPPADPSSG